MYESVKASEEVLRLDSKWGSNRSDIKIKYRESPYDLLLAFPLQVGHPTQHGKRIMKSDVAVINSFVAGITAQPAEWFPSIMDVLKESDGHFRTVQPRVLTLTLVG